MMRDIPSFNPEKKKKEISNNTPYHVFQTTVKMARRQKQQLLVYIVFSC